MHHTPSRHRGAFFMNRSFFISVIVVVVVGCVALFVFISSSLWFLVGLVPVQEDEKFVLAMKQDARISALSPLVQRYGIPTYLQKVTSRFSRFVYVEGDASAVIIAIPLWTHMFDATDGMRTDGWTIRRRGWFVVASKGLPNTHISFIRTVFSSLRSYADLAILQRRPINPIALAYARQGSRPYVERSYGAVAWSQDNKIYVSGSFDGKDIYDISIRGTVNENEEVQTNVSYVYVPPHFLIGTSDTLEEVWEPFIRSALGFTWTKPKFIHDMSALPNVLVIVSGNDVLLGSLGSRDGAQDIFQRWMNGEIAYNNPVKHAFKLPDGTYGFEYIPGSGDLNFSQDNNVKNCAFIELRAKKLQLCKDEQMAAITNNSSLFSSAKSMNLLEDNWQIHLSKNDANQRILGTIHDIHAYYFQDSFRVIFE